MKIVNENEFLEEIKEGVTLVDFYADWCGPCKMLGPILEQLSQENEDVNFIKVNVDDNNELAAEYQVMSIPCVYLFKDGEVKANSIGLKSKADMQSFIDENK